MRAFDRAAILVVLLGAFVVRVFRLGAQELRGDEAFGFFLSQNGYAQIVADTLALEEPHPVLSYFVQKSWMTYAGTSEFALRFVGVLLGVAAVALMFRLMLAQDLPIRVALMGAALLSLSPYAVWHSQDARMYSLSMALTLGSSVLAVMYLQAPRPSRGIGYVAMSLLALHTHYFAAFIILAQNLYVGSQWLARRVPTNRAGSWAVGQVVLWALYAPWLVSVRGILTEYRGNGDSPGLPEALSRAFGVFVAGESYPASQQAWWALLGILAAVVGFLALATVPRYRPAAWLFGLYLAVPVMAAWYGSQARPIFDERYLAAAAPPFYALAASVVVPLSHKPLGAINAWPRRAFEFGAAFLVLMLVLGGGVSLIRYFDDPGYSKSRGWRELAGTLERLSACLPAERVRLAQNYPDPTLWYYYTGGSDHMVLPPLANDAVLAGAEVDALVEQGVQRVVFVAQPAASWDGDGIGRAALEADFDLAAIDNSSNWPVLVYVRSDPSELQPSQESVSFETGATLVEHRLTSEYVVPGGVAEIMLSWDLTATDDREPVKVFVQLIDESGKLIAQEDRFLPAAGSSGQAPVLTEGYGILLPRELAPGKLRVIAGLYRPDAAGERVAVLDGGDHVELGTVAVWTGALPECAAAER